MSMGFLAPSNGVQNDSSWGSRKLISLEGIVPEISGS